MSTACQAKRARRKARIDPRYKRAKVRTRMFQGDRKIVRKKG